MLIPGTKVLDEPFQLIMAEAGYGLVAGHDGTVRAVEVCIPSVGHAHVEKIFLVLM